MSINEEAGDGQIEIVYNLSRSLGVWEMVASKKKMHADKGKSNIVISVQHLAYMHDRET